MSSTSGERRFTLLFVALALLLVVALVLGALVAIGAWVFTADRATYTAQPQQIEGVDFETAVENARGAGYTVRGPEYVDRPPGYAPRDASELLDRYGPDLRVQSITYSHGPSDLTVVFPARDGEPSRVVLTNGSVWSDGYTVADLPPEDWMVARLGEAFAVDERTARSYVDDLAAEIGDPSPDIPLRPHAPGPSISVRDTPDPTGARTALFEASTNTSVSPTGGDGSFVEFFDTGDRTSALIVYQVPRIVITVREGNARYRLWLDRLGGVRVQVALPAGERLPEAEYRGQYRTMFDTLGLPPDAVDAFEFEYDASTYVS